MLTRARFRSLESCVLPGVRQIETVANPAVATGWSISVPGGQTWRLLGGVATFVADANVANRFLGIQFTVQGVSVYVGFFSTAITASQTRTLQYEMQTPTSSAANISSSVTVPITPLWLPDGSKVQSIGGPLQAGDQYSAISLWFEQLYQTDQDLGDMYGGIEEQTEYGRQIRLVETGG